MREAYRVAGGQTPVKTRSGLQAPSVWRDWHAANAWQARAEAWDRECDRLAQAELVRERKRALQAQATAYSSALSVGLDGIRTKKDALGADGLGENTLVRLLEIGAAGLGRVYGTVPDQTVAVAAAAPEDEAGRRARIAALIDRLVPGDPTAEEIEVGDRGDAP